MQGYYFEPYIIPFIIGVLFLFARIWTRFFSWISVLPKRERRMMFRNIVSIHTFRGLWEAFSQILLHLRTFYINKKLWYIHLSLAFGWFLMIAVSKVNTAIYLKSPINPPYIEIFFSRYFPLHHSLFYDNLMDLLLVFVLSGFVMVIFKRRKPQSFGLNLDIKRSRFDKLASRSLWLIFPLRLVSESLNCAIFGGYGFLTSTLGDCFAFLLPFNTLITLNDVSWWLYSIASAVFMISIPFSRYLHIFAEIPLIFLRNFGVRAHEIPTTFTFLESAACSRCGLCNEVCPLIKSGTIAIGAPMSMVRNLRNKKRVTEVIDTCLACGECEKICPVKIEHSTIRLGEKYTVRHHFSRCDLTYLVGNEGVFDDIKEGKFLKVGYYAGCSTHQDLYILNAMTTILNHYEKDYIFVDKDARVCCGSPLRNTGNIRDAERLTQKLDNLILSSGVELLVVNCPTCYEMLQKREGLNGKVKIQFYTDYIYSKIKDENLKLGKTYSLFEPCPARKGNLDMTSTQKIVEMLGELTPSTEKNNCCGGSSFANTLSYKERQKIANYELLKFDTLHIDEMIAICPSCKRELSEGNVRVRDLSEVIAGVIAKE